MSAEWQAALAVLVGRCDDGVTGDLADFIDRLAAAGVDALLLAVARSWLAVLLSRSLSARGCPDRAALDTSDRLRAALVRQIGGVNG